MLRLVSRGKWCSYPEDQHDFVIPAEYTAKAAPTPRRSDSDVTLGNATLDDKGCILVTWYSDNDPANPQNWSLKKKVWVSFVIMYYTFAVYVGSAIFAYAIHDISVQMGVSEIVATLTLTLFVAGYAVGPLVLAPISEIAAIGRNPPYVLSLVVFCLLQIPSGLTNSFPGLAVLRFLSGFVGSPPLATAGASITDIFSEQKAGYAIGLYGLAAGVAPAIAPSISGFAIMRFGWRWAAWELLMMSGAGLLFLFFGLPETFAENILYRRAARLRRLTGNPRLRSHSEIADAEKSFGKIMKEALVRPLLMTFVEPIIIAINLYIGLIYAILYSYFESYPIVFGPGGYGWSLGISGLPFLSLTVGAMISYVIYAVWAYKVWEPQFVKAKGKLAPEAYLPLSQWGAFCYPICLFWFAWSANRTHWISPVISAAFFGLADCLSFMPYLSYLCVAYPDYVASAQASNDFVRSIMGAAMPIVARPMFNNLGIDWGNSLLGFLTVLFIPIPFILIKWGPWLRSKSRMATKYATDKDGVGMPEKAEVSEA